MKHSRRIIMLLSVFSCLSHASFTENTRRYLSPKDIMALWAQKFPQVTQLEYGQQSSASCWSIGSGNVNLTGAVNPAIGKPSVNAPPPGYVRWIGSCTNQIVFAQFQELKIQGKNEKLWRKYFPLDLLNKYRNKADAEQPFQKFFQSQWSTLSLDEQKSLITFSIEEMIGPEPVLKDLGYVKSMGDMMSLIQNATKDFSQYSVEAMMQRVLLATTLREEFITY